MQEIETISNYVNLQTRIRAAMIASVSILSGIVEADAVKTIQDMLAISEGRAVEGLKKDYIFTIKTLQLLKQLEELAERHMGYDS